MQIIKDTYNWEQKSFQFILTPNDAIFQLAGNGMDAPALVEYKAQEGAVAKTHWGANYATKDNLRSGYWFFGEALTQDQYSELDKILSNLRTGVSGVNLHGFNPRGLCGPKKLPGYHVAEAQKIHKAMRELCERMGMVQVNKNIEPSPTEPGNTIFRFRGTCEAPKIAA